jgi:hypothetical protein
MNLMMKVAAGDLWAMPLCDERMDLDLVDTLGSALG